MLDDLLSAPLAGRGGAELGLVGAQAMEGRGDLALKLAENGVHGGRITLHVWKSVG